MSQPRRPDVDRVRDALRDHDERPAADEQPATEDERPAAEEEQGDDERG